MGHYDGSKLALWGVAERYVLADNFFMGAFGGSFLNHIYLVCACIPKGDPFGPGTRIPAVIISPFAQKGTMDRTLDDTGSVRRFLARRFDLPARPGLARRDESIRAAGGVTPGDRTNALHLRGSAP